MVKQFLSLLQKNVTLLLFVFVQKMQNNCVSSANIEPSFLQHGIAYMTYNADLQPLRI